MIYENTNTFFALGSAKSDFNNLSYMEKKMYFDLI